MTEHQKFAHPSDYLPDPEREADRAIVTAHLIGAAEEVVPGFMERMEKIQAAEVARMLRKP